jgi:broad specificity phosphatase PhoE
MDMSVREAEAELPGTGTILLVRHAHTELAGRFCGQIDPPLSEQGRQQLPELAKVLAKYPLTHIFSSDLLRSQETASFIAAESGLTVEVLPSLREVSFGEWEGLNWEAVSNKDAAYAERWIERYPRLPAPGGEEFDGFRERVRGAMAEVALRISGGCAAVVTHGGVIRTFILDVLNLPESALASLEYGYASCTELCQRAGCWCLQD